MAQKGHLLNGQHISSHPILPISPLEKATSLQLPHIQQREGKRHSSAWHQEDLSALWLLTSPISMQITPFVPAKLLY